jgi:hypothetical protein
MRWSWRSRPTLEAAGRSDALDRAALRQNAATAVIRYGLVMPEYRRLGGSCRLPGAPTRMWQPLPEVPSAEQCHKTERFCTPGPT